ncbi:hypothetical protein [Cellulomonas xylanilytica]|uniref:Uncharacterized protein n=1 Tax=Cellulomonas xylanilytica TaxID=233583 RepID=A0A510V4H7_9CELL|nr:hypothetical protein [Cellulomonas xylanilytica]GEK20180.1 hypothetical protein CXY01_07000 [Cellulomonas xylanilytica]
MSDLGQLLAATETAVARARATSTPPPDALAGTLRRVRRRRTVRHSVQSVAGVAVVAALGVTAWLGTHVPDPPAPATTGTPTASPTTTPTPTPTPAAVAPAATVHVADPWPVPDGLIESTGPGWSLVQDMQTRTGTDPSKATPEDYRTLLTLVSPAGEHHPLLEVASDRVLTGWFDWTAGQPMVLFTSTDHSAASPEQLAGTLDLRTGDLTPWADLPASAMWIGGTRQGTTVWAVPQWDDTDMPDGGMPMPRNVLGPQLRMHGFAPTEFRLTVRAPDGTQRDLGPIDDSRYTTSLSPDGRWVTATAADGGLLLVDLRSGTSTTASQVPAEPPCTVGGWTGPDELLLSCGVPAELRVLDAREPSSAPRTVGTSEFTVVDATPLGDGRVALGILTQEAPCDVGGDAAVLADGVVSPLTGQWGPYDHASGSQVAGGSVLTELNVCYVGHGKAGRQRTISTDATTGAVTELGSLVGEVTDDGWDRSLYGWLVGR